MSHTFPIAFSVASIFGFEEVFCASTSAVNEFFAGAIIECPTGKDSTAAFRCSWRDGRLRAIVVVVVLGLFAVIGSWN